MENVVFSPLFVRQSAVSTSFHSSPRLKHLTTTSYPLRSEAQCGITNVTGLSKCRAPGLSNDSSMTSLTTASLSNRSGERKRGFHLRTVETLPSGGKIKCIPACLREQYVTASPLKIKRVKTPISDHLCVLESRDGAVAKALAYHECSLGSIPDFKPYLALACWFFTPLCEGFFSLFSKASSFSVSLNNQIS